MLARPKHPLEQTFVRVADITANTKMRLGSQAGEGWVDTPALFTERSPELARLVRDERQRLRTTTPNVIGSALCQNYQWPLISAAIATYLVARRVPDVTPANIQIWFSPSGYAEGIAFREASFLALPNDPGGGHPDATIVPDHATLRDRVRVGLERHLAWVIEQICCEVGCRSRGLWLAAADRISSSVAWLMQTLDAHTSLPQIGAEVDALVRVAGSPLASANGGLVELTSGIRREVVHERATCCYWYKADGGGYCRTCPGRPRTERTGPERTRR
jgi:hypothetical protein